MLSIPAQLPRPGSARISFAWPRGAIFTVYVQFLVSSGGGRKKLASSDGELSRLSAPRVLEFPAKAVLLLVRGRCRVMRQR